MLVDGDGDVLLLPAATRYETPGGGTETSTERRIIFSPEIPGRRVGSARPEWQVFGEAMARAFPERASSARFDDAASMRREIARAVPLYQGIETLGVKGDQIQWGGRTLFADGRFATADGKAHFVPVSQAPLALGTRESSDDPRTRVPRFRVSTRRGKQFNSMVQRDVDPLTGLSRDDVLMSAEDQASLGLRAGQRIRLSGPSGSFTGRVRTAPIKPGNLEVHWPEGNVLLSADAVDPESMEPDYNASVTVESLRDE
jgi:anaerobic selenocysteine-containing dehydrogenase